MMYPNGNIGEQYYDDRHRSILQYMDKCYAESSSINQTFWAQADQDHRAEAGDCTGNAMFNNLPANRRSTLGFNRCRPITNMIGGYQRKNRKTTIVVPVENGDNETADQFTKVLLWVNNQENVLETISDAFHGSLICGMNLLYVWMDYRNDPVSGNIKVDNCSYNQFLIDPFFRKRDLSDCNYIWKRSYLTKREILSLMPDREEEVLSLPTNTGSVGSDGKFFYTAESVGYSAQNLLSYDEFYFRDYRKQKMLVDTQTGETMEWRSDDKESLNLFLDTYPTVTLIEQEIPTVSLAIVIQNKVFYCGAQPSGLDLYPFVPVFAYYRPELPYYNLRVQGVVTGLKDAQYLYNRRKIIQLDILESQLNSGYIYKENALVNPKDIFMTGQGKGIALKETAQMTDVQPIQSPVIPPTTMEIANELAREIESISGVNSELMGSAIDDKAGILSMLRQGAGLTTLQGLFDNLDLAQKILGKLMIDLIQLNFTPGKIKKILEGEEPAQQFYNKSFGRYNAVVEEGFLSSTQKQMELMQLIQLKELGIPIPDSSLLEAATLQNKNKLVETIQAQQQQQAQQAQQQMELQMAQLKSQIDLAQARAAADKGLYVERVSRVEENRALAVQKLSEANKNDEQALLEKIKILKEIDDMDIGHIEKLITMANSLKANEQASVQEPKPLLKEQPKQNLSTE